MRKQKRARRYGKKKVNAKNQKRGLEERNAPRPPGVRREMNIPLDQKPSANKPVHARGHLGVLCAPRALLRAVRAPLRPTLVAHRRDQCSYTGDR